MDKKQLIADLQDAVSNNEIESLERLLEIASTEYTNEAFTVFFKGEYHLLLEDPITAIPFYENAMELDKNFNYQLTLALAYLRSSEDEKAKAILDELVEAAPNNADLHLAIAMYQSAKMEDALALEHLNKALEINPNQVEALDMRAFLLKSTMAFEEALKDYNKLIELLPNSESLRFQRIELNKMLKQQDQVLLDYQVLLDQDPDDVEYRVGLGDYHMSLGEYKDAEYLFSDAMDIERHAGMQSAYPLKKRGLALLRQGAYYKAMDDFKEVMKLEEEEPEGYLYMAEALQAVQQITKAISYLEIGLDLAFDSRWRLYEKLGQLCLETEQWLEAENAFEGMTRELAGQAEGFFQLGLLYVRQGDLEAAYEAFKESDDNLHENAAEMLERHCAEFILGDKLAAEKALMAEYEEDFAQNAASTVLKKAFDKLWKLDLSTTQQKNTLLTQLPEEMKSVLLKAFESMLINISPKGLFIFNLGQEDTRALYRIDQESSDSVTVSTQPFGRTATQELGFEISGKHFVLSGIGGEDTNLDLYFKEADLKQLAPAIQSEYKAKVAEGKMTFLGL